MAKIQTVVCEWAFQLERPVALCCCGTVEFSDKGCGGIFLPRPPSPLPPGAPIQVSQEVQPGGMLASHLPSLLRNLSSPSPSLKSSTPLSK